MDNANTPNTPLRALMAQCVANAWITPAQADAVASCVEVGYDGAPDEVAEVLMPLVGVSAKGDPTKDLWGKAPAPEGGLVLTETGFSVALAEPGEAPKWKAEFPSYGDDLGIEPPHGWEDVSWCNDACPSFQLVTESGEAFRLFVDYADPAAREIGPDDCRFRVALWAGEGGHFVRDVYETDDPRAMRAFCLLVSLREEVLDWQASLGGERDGLDSLCSACDAVIDEDMS